MDIAAVNRDPPLTLATVACRTCQRANPAGRRFCSGCGQPLWQVCPQCRAECAADERFCGGCGADVAAGLQEQGQAWQARIAAALELAAGCQYDDALATLQSVAAISDARFQHFALAAQAHIERVEKERDEQLAAAEQALRAAQQFFTAHAYERTQHALEQIPPPLRTDAHAALLDRAKACRQEILSLSGEIRAAVAEKRAWDLGPKLDRLLALKPGHEQARQLGEQLRANAVKIAKARLTEHQYQEALDRLQQIPVSANDEETEKLYEAANERLCLFDELKGGALAEARLLALADRLCKLSPNHAVAVKFRGQLAKKVPTKPADPRLGAADWQPPPKRTLLGAPVDWLAHFTRAAPTDPTVAQTLREHPGQFFVALGLALEGVGLAAIGANLTPPEKGSLAGILPVLGLGRRAATAAWGLDLSDYAIKAVKLVREGKDEVKVAAAEYILTGSTKTESADSGPSADGRDATLQDFVARAGDLKGVKMCVGLAGQRVLGRFFELPPMPARKAADSVQFEARHQLPVALEELCWSHQALDEATGKTADEQPRRIVVQACREAHVQERLGCFKAAGITVDLVQSDSVALHNALAFELLQNLDASQAAAAVAAIDVGSESTNVVVSSPRCVWFRNVGLGSNAFLRELIKHLQITGDQADNVLREPARARRFYLFREALAPLFIQLGSEIERSLATYRKLFPDHPIRQVYGLGGGFQTLGLLRYLRTGK